MQEQVALQDRALTITRSQLAAGEVSPLEVSQAANLVAATKAAIAPLEAAQANARYRLATLAGRPASWRWPERMAARTLDMPRWEAGQRMMQSADAAQFRAIVAADKIVTANRETIEGCSKAANRARATVRCTIKVAP